MTPENKNVAGLVIAGGQSKRMGRDKALLATPDGGTLLQHAIDALSDLEVLGLSAPKGRYRVTVPVIPDLRPGMGPLAGLEAGLVWAAERDCQWLLTRPVDLPLFPTRWLFDLLQNAREHKRISACYSATYARGPGATEMLVHPQPLCAAWKVECLDGLRAYLDRGRRSAVDLHRELDSLVISSQYLVSPDQADRIFLNVNTDESYAEVLARWE